jgi:hypothetical protein
MVNALRSSPAVLAKIVVTREYGPAVQRSTPPIRSANLILQASYRWGEDFKLFGAQHPLSCVNDFCLIG